jgi:SAM-dependent methyltransferase
VNKPGLGVTEREDPVRAAVEAFVRRSAPLAAPGACVLDAGAGECVYRPLFEGRRYLAFDRGVGDPGWNYGALNARADLERLPLQDGSIDFVLCTETLEHVARPDRVLAEFGRVLKPGGALALSVPFLHPVHQAPHDYFRYTPHGLDHLLRRAGLLASHVDTAGGYFLHLYWQLQDLPSQLPLGPGRTPGSWLSWPLRAIVRLLGALLREAAWALRRRGAPDNRPLGYFILAQRP